MASAFQRLACANAEPHRTEHNLRPIRARGSNELKAAHSLTEQPAVMETASCFHEIVCAHNTVINEADSAKFAALDLAAAGVAPANVAQLHALTLATHHRVPEPHHDAALLPDANRASFGRTADKVGAHERAICEELFQVEPDS